MGCAGSTEDFGGRVWNGRGGTDFDDALSPSARLGDSPVRLLDARYLIKLAFLGKLLVHRQALPEEAFLPLPELKKFGCGTGGSLRVVVVSYPWLQPDHPDPHGETLQLLARVLRAYLVNTHDNGTCGVFLDFCSLHQKGAAGEARSASEAELFGMALNNLSNWYSHPNTIVLKLTKMPEGYCTPVASPLLLARRPTLPIITDAVGAFASRRWPTS